MDSQPPIRQIPNNFKIKTGQLGLEYWNKNSGLTLQVMETALNSLAARYDARASFRKIYLAMFER